MSEHTATSFITVHGVKLEVVERGQGRPILVLHGEDGLEPSSPFLNSLATAGRVIAPSHPGYGHSPDVDSIDTVDDLAYLYLDLLSEQNLRDVVVLGCSLGGVDRCGNGSEVHRMYVSTHFDCSAWHQSW
jgi:pimeloyl-ACP methyl ester carboxylesterase